MLECLNVGIFRLGVDVGVGVELMFNLSSLPLTPDPCPLTLSPNPYSLLPITYSR